tara:strand:- start:3864 stop:4700 length:837 start_codon:yes stop_codon:yes gene_type:complete
VKTVIARNIKSLRFLLDKEKKNKIGLVPTMGGLHQGHISLIKQSKSLNYFTVVTIFLNPKQFDHKTDLLKYPATEKKDITLLKKLNVNIIFIPRAKEIYPKKFNTYITENLLSKILCGRKRKNHFTGVLTVVLKLFMLIKPEAAFFGEKDYQQLLIIKKMIKDLNLEVKVLECKTIRDKYGLAYSSRNNLLNSKNLATARKLNYNLKKSIKIKNKPVQQVINFIKQELKKEGIKQVEYLEIREDKNLVEAKRMNQNNLRMFIAVKIGNVRLIDNIKIT